jgi:inositol transport system substrate-binding protein
MKRLSKMALLAGVMGLALSVGAPAQAAGKHLTILFSVPNMAFPFFVHMVDAVKQEATKLGDIDIVESDGQGSSPKQTADIEAAITKGVDGIVISPNEVDAMAPGLQEAIDANIPVVTIDRRVDAVSGILAHVGADNVKGGEAQGELIMKLFPNGASVMNLQGQSGASPAIDRNKGLHNVLDKAPDKYKFVFEDTAGFQRDKGQTMTESALASMATPPDVIVAANDDMSLGAMEALKARNLTGKVVLIGFDALPEALAAIRDGTQTATVEQMPGGQTSGALDTIVSFLRDGTQPANKVTLLTPIAITKDNLDQAERMGEVK